MFCSTIIPTIGRPTLSQAVQSVLDQEFTAGDFEIIVVNDSGRPLPEAYWQKSGKVQVINTTGRERCVARNTGAALAKGKYLHFLDDDDWLLPGALESFWRLSLTTSAVWLYGKTRFVDAEDKLLAKLDLAINGNCFAQVLAGLWIPVQASLIKTSAFFDIGGFDPTLVGTEDLDLCRRIALHEDLAGTSTYVACMLRGTSWGSTTNYHNNIELVSRGRDNILGQPNAFTRARASANSSYWQGRIFHAYLSTTLRNLRHKRLFTACSRALYMLASFILSGSYIFSPRFWHAVRTHRVTEDLFGVQ